jgi:hypothetical protein
VVIHDFNVARALIAFGPFEANPPLVVDADAVLTAPISPQGFEPVSWEAPQRLQVRGGFQAVEPLFCLPEETLECPDMLAFGKFGVRLSR